MTAVRELDYQPDVRAQMLRSGGITNTIGLLVPDMHNPYYWKIAAGVEHEAQKAGFDLVLFTTSLDAQREERTLRALTRRQIAGLILNPTYPTFISDALKQLTRRRYPVVTLETMFPHIDTVESIPGYYVLAKQLVAHLFTLGHRRIGLIYGVVNPEIDGGRLAAYCEMLQAAGLPVEEALIARCGATLDDGYQAAQQLLWLRPRPTALMAINDLLAMGALRAIGEQGLTVPDDLSLTGFDDIDMAAYLLPPLTTVQYDADAAGRAAVKLLLERLADPTRPAQLVQVSSRLLIRGSTGTAPANVEA